MIKTPKTILTVCTLLLVIISCSPKKEQYKITGQVSGFPDGTTLYLRNLATDAVFDSAVVTNNSFKFEGQLADPPEQIWLNTTIDKKFVYTNLMIGNDDIEIKGDIEDFPWNVDIKGSKTQEDFDYSQSITREYSIERDSMVRNYLSLLPEEKKELWETFNGELKHIDSIIKGLNVKYIKSHPGTYASVIQLGYLKNKLPKDTVQNNFDKYSPEIKESKYGRVIKVFLREHIAETGDQYHDFEGWNQKDEKVKFSEIKGEYSLIDFTAAYCGPCIQAADELVDIHETYSDSLNIISFSGDPQKEVWLKSLERDKVTWNSVWDGKGRYSETSIKYGIQGFPTFVLINPEGVIIDKWSGYGKGSLKSRLEKTLAQK